MTYFIMGRFQQGTEVIDEFDTKEEADAMLSEYRLAFGSSWSLWIAKS